MPKFPFKRHKRLIIGVLIGVVALIFAVYGILSYLAWQNMDRHASGAALELKTAIEGSLGAEEGSGTPVIEQAEQLIADFESTYGDHPCDVSPLYRWQTFVPAVADLRSSCEERFARVTATIEALRPVVTFLKSQQTAADLVKEAMTKSAEADSPAAAAGIWHALSLWEELPRGSEIAPVTEKITTVASTIADAYDALASANENEDKAAYDRATEALGQAYADLGGIAPIATEQQTQLVTTFVDTYKKL